MTHPQQARGAAQVRRIVTPAQAGRLNVAGSGTTRATTRVHTPAQQNADAARAAEDIITAVPGIVRLVGPFTAVRTPSTVGDRRIEVHGNTMRVSVVIDGRRPIPEVERDVRSAVARQWGGPLDLVFADLELPGESSDEKGEGE